MPPQITARALKTNSEQVVAGRELDATAKYGYMREFYKFTANYDDETIDDFAEQDAHDEYKIYKTTVTI